MSTVSFSYSQVPEIDKTSKDRSLASCLHLQIMHLPQVLQHTWTYKPLVHDVLGMDLNRITVDESAGKSVLPGVQPSAKKSFEVGDGDFFWEANGRAQFPKVAAEVEGQISQYKQVRLRWNPGGHLLSHTVGK